MPTRIRPAAARWKQTRQLIGIDSMPTTTQLLGALMYFSGFQAGLEASDEAARLPRREAGQALEELKTEVDTFHQIAAAALANGNTPH